MNGKLRDLDDAVGTISDGMTVGIGGWGSRRKPMSLVRALIRSGARDLRIVSFGGPDVGLLCATGQVREVTAGFVSLDSIAIDPHFARAREHGEIGFVELDEAMLVAGLRAAAHRLPFELTRSGLGSDAVRSNPQILTIVSPYPDREEFVAMPAVPLDVALIHVDVADDRGSARILAPDGHFDDLFALAAEHVILSTERVVPTAELPAFAPGGSLDRTMVHAVVEAPAGAHFTDAPAVAARDEAMQRAYVAAAADREAWERFRDAFLLVDESGYHRAVSAFHAGGAA